MPLSRPTNWTASIGLSELDIDYFDHQNTFSDLARLAAKVAGTRISLVNLIDSLTQWTISNYALDIDKPTLQIIVKDEGVGMDAAGVDAIVSGTSASTDGTAGEHGYGFGLTLVKHLVASLDGQLNIISNPGEGTSFVVELPQKIY